MRQPKAYLKGNVIDVDGNLKMMLRDRQSSSEKTDAFVPGSSFRGTREHECSAAPVPNDSQTLRLPEVLSSEREGPSRLMQDMSLVPGRVGAAANPTLTIYVVSDFMN